MNKAIALVGENQRAYMLGRYTIDCVPEGGDCAQRFNNISVLYGNNHFDGLVGSISSSYGSMFIDDTKFDFINIDKQEKGFYFCHELPPNNYSIFDLRFYHLSGRLHYLNPESFIDLPVHIVPSEAVYVGNLKVTTSIAKNMLGLNISSPGSIVLSLPRIEEVQKAMEKCPESAKDKKVRFSPLNAKMANGHPLVLDSSAN